MGLLCLSTLSAGSQEVLYELSDGSSLTRWPCRGVEGSTGELSGSFALRLGQSHRVVSAAIVAVDFRTVSGPDYHLTGEGYLFLGAPPGASACLPAARGIDLCLRVNDSEDIYLTTELGPMETFPKITVRAYQMSGENGNNGCFVIDIVAIPRPQDAYQFFRRGDANGDGQTDISDAVSILEFLFYGTAGPSCLDAADVNDDSNINISDPITLLTSLFLGANPIRIPSCFCGLDPTEDALDCKVEPVCMAE